jgi:hypothetical protein
VGHRAVCAILLQPTSVPLVRIRLTRIGRSPFGRAGQDFSVAYARIGDGRPRSARSGTALGEEDPRVGRSRWRCDACRCVYAVGLVISPVKRAGTVLDTRSLRRRGGPKIVGRMPRHSHIGRSWGLLPSSSGRSAGRGAQRRTLPRDCAFVTRVAPDGGRRSPLLSAGALVTS